MYIIRYADDFRIFCRKRSDAVKTYHAVKLWLEERLKLQISEEKSKVVNLKKNYSEFLGFKLKAVPRGGKYIVRSHMCDKAIQNTTKKLKAQIDYIQHPVNRKEEYKAILLYNSMVIGMHQYFAIATLISDDCSGIGQSIKHADNRISLYAAQYGKCAVTRLELEFDEIHCHHKIPVEKGGADVYANLVIVHKDVRTLIHATQQDTIDWYLKRLNLDSTMRKKLNRLRQMVGNFPI